MEFTREQLDALYNCFKDANLPVNDSQEVVDARWSVVVSAFGGEARAVLGLRNWCQANNWTEFRMGSLGQHGEVRT